MKKAPEVLTRMRLSCCWGDNLNEKELNDVVDYINGLEQQCKKQKEVIDRTINAIDLVIELIKQQPTEDDTWILSRLNAFKIILKEVSE